MSSRKEEERNEKIIRGLMKLPPNRRCINCNGLGPQYVCTNFWTFVCIACSGIHREFTHRVKSVSMAKFTAQEVEALQRGGNQCAREIFLTKWDAQRTRLPDSSKPDKIREFIKSVYVDKNYAGSRSSDKPPRDMQSPKYHEQDHRRASSYHSYSQSPPYEHQYEDRRYGKQTGMLTRKPGSDRGHYEAKISSFIYSPSQLGEQMYEDRFANEGSCPRISDYSVSSAGDAFRYDGQSPNFQRDTGYSSPPMHPVREILIEDGRRQISNTFSEANTKRDVDGVPRSQRTASSGSFGSFDSNTVSLKSVNSSSLIDVLLESEQTTGTQLAEASAVSSLPQSSTSSHAANQDLFGPPFIQQPATSSPPSIDLFAEINQQPSTITPDKMLFSVPLSENEGWATFDLPHQAGPAFETQTLPAAAVPNADETQKGSFDAFSSVTNNRSQWPSVETATVHEPLTLMADHWDAAHEVKMSTGPASSQSWNAFGDSFGNFPQTSFGSSLPKSEPQVPAHSPPIAGDPYMGLKVLEDSNKDVFPISTTDNRDPGNNVSFNNTLSGSSFTPSMQNDLFYGSQEGKTNDRKSTNPFDLPFDSDLEPSNVFLDMSSLQSTLPSAQFPAPFLGSLGQPWFSQNPVPPYISSITPGGSAYMAGQPPTSQLPNMPSQGPVASLGGNPFA